jgi:hypothetical protein
MFDYNGIASGQNLPDGTRRGACNANGRCPVPTQSGHWATANKSPVVPPKLTFAGLPTTRTFGTKNAPLEMSHEPAVNAPDLIAAVSSSNRR